MKKLIILALLSACSVTHAELPGITRSSIETWLRDPSSLKSNPFSDSNPDSVAVEVIRALNEDQRKNSQAVIQILEPLLPRIKFSGLEQKLNNHESQLWVGMVGSFDLWRDLIYSLLGRAYYELKDYSSARVYLQAVNPNGAFGRVAELELGWALIQAGDFDEASRVVSKRDTNEAELLLQKAFLSLQKSDLSQSIQYAEGARFSEQTELFAIQQKILAQAKAEKFNNDRGSLSLNQKIQGLREILAHAERVSVQQRDADFSTFAGETWWSLASVYRIEDPAKYRSQVSSALSSAHNWLAPWIEKSITQKKALITEESWFLSSSILWEQGKMSVALPQLSWHPIFFPKGRFLADSYQMLGDYFYEQTNYAKSVEYYRRLADSGDAEKSAYGVYKAAWAFYNQGEKWKSLRHLERLLLFYRDGGKDSSDGLSEYSLNLKKETEQDLLLLLAEQLSAPQALKELSLFHYSGEEEIQIAERLGQTYKQMGRYEESVGVWNQLLSKATTSEKAYDWLNQMLLSILSSGQRVKIAATAEKYIPIVKKYASAEGEEKERKFESLLGKLILTIHHEAEKTEDKDIWLATDGLYQSFVKYFPESKEAEVWFFGAQRKEKIGETAGAVAFYQKAAQVDGFANSKDAAQSVLRLAKKLLESPKPNHDPIIQSARWYLQKFPKSPEHKAAQYLLVESYVRTGKWKDAREFLISTVDEEGWNPVLKDLVGSFNRAAYQARRWDEAYQLSIDAYARARDRKEEAAFIKSIAQVYQEAPFQIAFEREKKNPTESYEWYVKASKAPVNDPMVWMKAWHNSFATSEDLAEHYESFQKAFAEVAPKFRELSGRDALALRFAIHARLANEFDKKSDLQGRSRALFEMAQTTVDTAQADNLLWESFVLFNALGLKNDAQQALEWARTHQPNFLRDPKRRANYGSLVLWQGDFKRARDILVQSQSEFAKSPDLQLFARDLLVASVQGNEEVFAAVRSLLKSQQESVRASNIFTGLDWLYSGKTSGGADGQLALREPSSATGKLNAPSLKERLAGIASLIQEMSERKTMIQKSARGGSPQQVLQAVCQSEQVTAETVSGLSVAKSHPVQSAQWVVFVDKLNQKLAELNKIEKEESSQCENQKEKWYALPLGKLSKRTPVCEEENCYSLGVEKDPDSFKSLVKEFQSSKGGPTFGILDRALREHAWGLAWYYTMLVKQESQRAMLLAFIRLGQNDSWNAQSFLDAAKKDPQWREPAALLEAGIAVHNGHRDIAVRKLRQIRSELSGAWEKEFRLTLRERLSLQAE